MLTTNNVQALVQREEAAKQARVDATKRRQQEAAEEEIKEAGKRMLAEAQKRRAAAVSAGTAAAAAAPSSNGAAPGPSPTSQHQSTAAGSSAHPPSATTSTSTSVQTPTITPLDLTLILQFPPSSPSTQTDQSELHQTLSRAYGPISHVFIKDPPASAPTADVTGVEVAGAGERPKKKAKTKGRKAIVEFQEGNWGGCWSCWKDLDSAASTASATASAAGGNAGWALEGVKVKWAAGKIPDWVEWAASQRPRLPKVKGNSEGTNGANGAAGSDTAQGGGAAPGTAPSFDSAPDFARSTMADLLASHNQTRDDAASRKRQEQDFESMTLLRMRQLERDRLAEQIRREEEDEGVA